jgi:hypothetical protein
MPNFEVIYTTTFTNRVWVEAEGSAEALLKSGEEDFLQKHTDEEIISCLETPLTYDEWYNQCHDEEYW